MFIALVFLAMISASMSLPVDYQPSSDSNYQPGVFSKDKKEARPQFARHGRRGYYDSAHVYGVDRQQRRKVPDTYYEPISV